MALPICDLLKSCCTGPSASRPDTEFVVFKMFAHLMLSMHLGISVALASAPPKRMLSFPIPPPVQADPSTKKRVLRILRRPCSRVPPGVW